MLIMMGRELFDVARNEDYCKCGRHIDDHDLRGWTAEMCAELRRNR